MVVGSTEGLWRDWSVEREEKTYCSISVVIDGARIEAGALERTPLAGRAEVTLHRSVEAAKEVELQGVAHIGRRGVGREDEAALAHVDLDDLCARAAGCQQGEERN